MLICFFTPSLLSVIFVHVLYDVVFLLNCPSLANFGVVLQILCLLFVFNFTFTFDALGQLNQSGIQSPRAIASKNVLVWDVSFHASFKNSFTLDVFLHYLIFCKFSMFLRGLIVYEHPSLKCLMLAQFGQQTRCCRFPFFQIEDWPWCRRPAIWAKPNSYFVTHPSQNGIRLQTSLSRQSVLIGAQVRFVRLSSQKQNRLPQSQDFGLDGDWGV